MAFNQKLLTDQDFQEAMDRNVRIRVFQDDHIIDSDGVIIRFDDNTIITQSGVSDLSYHPREHCEFYEMKKR